MVMLVILENEALGTLQEAVLSVAQFSRGAVMLNVPTARQRKSRDRDDTANSIALNHLRSRTKGVRANA
jgi:hypothetical protein